MTLSFMVKMVVLCVCCLQHTQSHASSLSSSSSSSSSSSVRRELFSQRSSPALITHSKQVSNQGLYIQNQLWAEVYITSADKSYTCKVGETIFIETSTALDDPILFKLADGRSISPLVDKLGNCFARDDLRCRRLVLEEHDYHAIEKANINIFDFAIARILVTNRRSLEYKSTGEIFYSWYDVKGHKINQLTRPRKIDSGNTECLLYPASQNLLFNPDNNYAVNPILVIGLKDSYLKKNEFDGQCFQGDPAQYLSEKSKELLVTGSRNSHLSIRHHENTIELVNATESPVYYKLIGTDEKGRNDVVGEVAHILGAQKTTYFSTEDTRYSQINDLKLYVTPDELHVQTINGKTILSYFDLSKGLVSPRRLLITHALDGGPQPYIIVALETSGISVLPLILEKRQKNNPDALESSLASFAGSAAQLIPDKNNSISDAKLGTLPKEQAFIADRKDTVWESIVRFLGNDELEKLISECSYQVPDDLPLLAFLKKFPAPLIGIALSGGDYRAMIHAIGFLSAAHQKDFFACCTYMTGTSGASWALTSLVASQKNPQEFAEKQKANIIERGRGVNPSEVSALQDQIGEDIPEELMKEVLESNEYVRTLARQCLFQQAQGVEGLLGHALAHKLLKGFEINSRQRHELSLSDLQGALSSHSYPMPICSATFYSEKLPPDQRYFEFSPYYIAYSRVGRKANYEALSISTETFGSFYKDDRVFHAAPEYPLAQLWGIWGLGVSFAPSKAVPTANKDVLAEERVKKSMRSILRMSIKKFLDSDYLEHVDLGKIHNHLYRSVQGISLPYPMIRKISELFLCDAKLSAAEMDSHLFAILPLLDRQVHLIIMYDTSKSARNGSNEQLLAVASEANSMYVPFQKIETDSQQMPALCVTQNQEAPALVYIRATRASKNVSPQKKIGSKFGCTSEEYESCMQDALENVASSATLIQLKNGVKEAVRRVLVQDRQAQPKPMS